MWNIATKLILKRYMVYGRVVCYFKFWAVTKVRSIGANWYRSFLKWHHTDPYFLLYLYSRMLISLTDFKYLSEVNHSPTSITLLSDSQFSRCERSILRCNYWLGHCSPLDCSLFVLKWSGLEMWNFRSDDHRLIVIKIKIKTAVG